MYASPSPFLPQDETVKVYPFLSDYNKDNNTYIRTIEKYKNSRRKLSDEFKNNNNPRKTTDQTWAKCGPPTWLNSQDKASWNSIIDHSLIYCRNNILFPKWIEKVQKAQETARRLILGKNGNAINNLLKLIQNLRIMTGHYEEDLNFILSLLPPPPKEGNDEKIGEMIGDKKAKFKEKWVDKKQLEAKGIGNLIRGEIWGPLVLVNKIDEETGFSLDVFKVIAKAIYGSIKKKKLIVRSIVKFLQIYDRVEKEAFIPYVVKDNKNRSRKINNWNEFKQVIINRDIQITMYELNIIARLYDVQIRLFHEVVFKNNLIYACKWQSCFCRYRVINLLHRTPDTWALLRGQVRQKDYSTNQVIINNNNSVHKEEILEKGSNSTTTSFESARDYTEVEQDINIVEDRREEYEIDQKEDNRDLFYSVITAPSTIDNNIDLQEDKDSIITPIIQIDTNSNYSTDSVLLDPRIINMQIREDRKEIRNKKMSRRDIWRKWKKANRVRKRNKRRSQIRKDTKKHRDRIASSVVYDFTTDKLTGQEISLLSKGETFSIANDKIDEDVLKVDIYNYNRRLRLHDLFREHNVEEVDVTNINSQNTLNTQIRTNSRHTINSQLGQITLPKAATNRMSKVCSNTIASKTPIASTAEPKIVTATVRLPRFTHNSQPKETGIPRTLIVKSSRVNNRVLRQTQTPQITQPKASLLRKVANKQAQPTHIDTIVRRKQIAYKAIPKIIQGREVRRGVNMHTPHNNSTQTNTIQSKLASPNNSLLQPERNTQTELTSNRKLPSSFDIDSKNRNLVRYNTCIQEESTLIVKDKIEHKDNITKLEREAMKTLTDKINNNKIVITKADKGSGIVVVDYDMYINKGSNYIEVEAKAYTRTDITEGKIVQNIAKKRNKIVKQLREHKIITKETATYCMKQVEEKVTGMKFYYKVHKDTNITTMPLRPLQSCISAPTHHLSIVLTDILQPLLAVKNIPTFISDTNQLLVRLSKVPQLSKEDTLISSDVAALYPSIPHNSGLQAIEQFLIDTTHFTIAQITILKSALELVITENFVRWNSHIYQQTSGVAMGTPVAVAYANIFMHWIDRKLHIKAPYIIEHIRYIDDNLFILPKEKIDNLMEIANNILYPHIRYTYEKLDKDSDKGLPFLDTQLFISEANTIESRLYTKQTDKHTYLLPSSFHPPHITKNIPAAVFSRIKRICSKEEYYISDAAKAIEWLINRGYSKVEILGAKHKISSKDRLEMIDTIERKRLPSNIELQKEVFHIPFIVTYNNRTVKIKKILKDRQKLLDTCFTNTKIRPRLVYRRQRNLNDIFIQKSLRKPIQVEEQGEIVKCGEEEQHRVPCPCRGMHNQTICRCCAHLVTEQKNKVKLYKQVTCNSKNLVYVIGCKQCEKMYIGETQQRLKDRLLQHLNNVWKLNQPLYLHFRLMHKPLDLTISVLETVRRIEPIYRKVREAWWINHLQTLEPLGFNVKLDCNQIYSNSSSNTMRPVTHS